MAADAIFAKKGMDIVLLDVEELFSLADVFVIATGNSRPHVQSLAEHVEEKLREDERLNQRGSGCSSTSETSSFISSRSHHGSSTVSRGCGLTRIASPGSSLSSPTAE